MGWLGEADGTWRAFAYAVDGGYRPTGAAALPDGGVLVLERRFPPLGVRLRFVRNESLTPAALRGSPVVKAEAVANFAPSMTMDNMEGVDVLVTGDGRRLVFLVSDDNFSALQSTLLMMFEWPQGEAGDAGDAGR